MYVYNAGTSAAMYVAILRGLTAVPAHALFGLTMGLMFINYSFIKKSNQNLIMCFIYPALMHAAYNFLVGYTSLFLVIIVLIFSWRLQLGKFRDFKALQQIQKDYKKI
jgi:RsiW-degrading membrane proteinase PrsW (M82 family)